MSAELFLDFRIGDGTFGFPREVRDYTLVCPTCGAPAERVKCTAAERKNNGCGRASDCCSVAWRCGNKHRTSVRLAAPEFG